MECALKIETDDGVVITKDKFAKSKVFHYVILKPQKGDIVMDDDNNYYEILNNIWCNEKSTGYDISLKVIVKQVSFEVKQEVILMNENNPIV